jgi:hypothetical protein
MKFMKDNAVLIALSLAVIVAGGSLMIVSQKVYDTQKNVQALDRELLTKQWDVRSLKAELAYLSRPDRLEQISSAIAQSVPPIAGSSPIAPVVYHLSKDLPAGMSLLPPTKPVSAIHQKKKTVKHNIGAVRPYEALPVPSVSGPEKREAKKSSGFASLIDSLGGE